MCAWSKIWWELSASQSQHLSLALSYGTWNLSSLLIVLYLLVLCEVVYFSICVCVCDSSKTLTRNGKTPSVAGTDEKTITAKTATANGIQSGEPDSQTAAFVDVCLLIYSYTYSLTYFITHLQAEQWLVIHVFELKEPIYLHSQSFVTTTTTVQYSLPSTSVILPSIFNVARVTAAKDVSSDLVILLIWYQLLRTDAKFFRLVLPCVLTLLRWWGGGKSRYFRLSSRAKASNYQRVLIIEVLLFN